MLPLRYALRWRLAGLLLLLVVLAGAIAPVALWPEKARALGLFEDLDKWVHGLTFAVLSLWFSGQYAKSAYWRIALGLLVFGAAIELCQRFVGYRTPDLGDALANMVGILVGLGIAVAGLGGWSQAIERRLLASSPDDH